VPSLYEARYTRTARSKPSEKKRDAPLPVMNALLPNWRTRPNPSVPPVPLQAYGPRPHRAGDHGGAARGMPFCHAWDILPVPFRERSEESCLRWRSSCSIIQGMRRSRLVPSHGEYCCLQSFASATSNSGISMSAFPAVAEIDSVLKDP
jgi:hypothetical protein